MKVKVLPSIQDIHTAINTVSDPEYPEISIVDLGFLENVEINEVGEVFIELIPTFSGCPALETIAQDVREATEQLPGVHAVEVTWLNSPVWSVKRVTEKAKKDLAEKFTVAVQIQNKKVECPRCQSETNIKSHFGPSRCRSIHVCSKCHEVVETLRD
ncbi:MAG TPA: 1,2-phenylacetyl-CoA epoxidase subunit PaaD [Acidimicrobiales bacterium]|mgnify:CR=1 FL=1|nr:1,2-phenylacetyl-CoA epoxidase subunit PaaD [Acidimicrobiales bacterium]|tara:strand:- start:3161 stop:3631 length:471 start_codon:yes stop_codon:yes gene_type:complete